MLTIDRQPPLPDLPEFRHDMEAFLVAAARTRRVRRVRRRMSPRGYWAAAATAAAVAVAITLGIVLTQGGARPDRTPAPMQLASFAVSTGPGGLVELRLSPGQLRDPAALRHALAKVGVPALVTDNKVCYVPGPSAILTQVLPGAPQHQADGSTVWTINPMAIPSGIELSIGYFHVTSGFGIHVTVVPVHGALTCAQRPPTPPRG